MIVGCGYLGAALARMARDRGGVSVAGFARNSETLREWSARGFETIEGDVTRPADFAQMARFAPDAVVYCVAGGRAGGENLYRAIYHDGLSHLLDALGQVAPAAKVIFTGSTSVYTESDGAWVDETSPAEPRDGTAAILRRTEKMLLARWPGAFALRLAGIYGPGRGVLLQKVLKTADQPVDDNPERWLNLIHVEDIAAGILDLMQIAPVEGGIYNLCDDEPIRLGDYYDWVRTTAGLPPVQFAPAQPRPLNKRISNRKIKSLFPRNLLYPNFRAGLATDIPGA